jgi:mannose-6-phosphate isomerase
MPKLDCPLLLSPVFKPKIWGRKNVAPLFARPETKPERSTCAGSAQSAIGKNDLIGEVWITDDQSRFLNGFVAGLTLDEASRKFGSELSGSGWTNERFPLLAKYIYTSDWLSVQAHPDDAYARIHDPGSPGKCEMWYFLHAEKEAAILQGLKPGVTKEKLRAAMENGTLPNLLHRFHPRAGEAAYLPPGTVHALGPGLVLFEVEQNSDLTYRLDDFGRVGLDGKPRPLHLKKGLEVTKVDLPAYRDLPRIELREPFGARRYVMASRHFALEELTVKEIATLAGSPERVEVFSVLEGYGRVETDAGWLGCETGDTWLIPPATKSYRVAPRKKIRLLRFYVPDIEKDFRRLLLKRRVARSKIERICFE